MEKRATEFVEYEPIATDSRYYSDAGKVALTTTYDYVKENESYFNDAAFWETPALWAYRTMPDWTARTSSATMA